MTKLEMVQIFRFDAEDDRPERYSWEVCFTDKSLDQEGYEPSLAKALLRVSVALLNAQDDSREGE